MACWRQAGWATGCSEWADGEFVASRQQCLPRQSKAPYCHHPSAVSALAAGPKYSALPAKERKRTPVSLCAI